MSKNSNEKLQAMVKDYHLLIEAEMFGDDEDGISDIYYSEFYLIKKYSQEYGVNLNNIKKSTTYNDYKNTIKKEWKKIDNPLISDKWWGWNRFYNDKEIVFDFINNLEMKDFDIYLPSYAWFCDKRLNKYIDFSKTKNILSIFNTFYSDKITDDCNVDVIYYTFQQGNMESHSYRLDIIGKKNYKFENKPFPSKINKKYDLVVFNLEYSSIESLDKTGLISLDENGGQFSGDSVQQNICEIDNYLTNDGIAIIKTPFTFVSKLNDELINKNIIDKIIYLPSEKEAFYDNYIDVKSVYIIVKNNKVKDEIEFVDIETKSSCIVTNEQIKRHKGCANMNLYIKHNPMLNKLYKIKEDNIKQIKIINDESKIIDKQIDELDFL